MSTSTPNSHLSFPSSSTPDTNVSPTTMSSPQPRPLLKDRLYIGNLHPTVDEYTLLKIFSKFGKVTKLDFLFHKAGPCKGKPRGYAFVEYGDQSDALRALVTANDKLLRGRKLVVTFAHQAPLDATVTGAHSRSLGHATKFRKGMTEANRPTTLSLLKSGLGSRNEGDKIAIMEAKLQQMERSHTVTSTPSTTSIPPFLPAKPPPSFPDSVLATSTSNLVRRPIASNQTPPLKGKGSMNPDRKYMPLPSLPILPRKVTESKTGNLPHDYGMELRPQTLQKTSTSSLAGMRIGKIQGQMETTAMDQDDNV